MLVSKSVLAGVAALAGLGFLALPVSAEAAAGSVSKECSAQYQAAKKAGTLNGQKWPQYYSDCAAKMKGGTTAAEDTTAKTKKASKSEASTKKAEKTEKSTSKKEAKSSGQSTQQVCSEQYQAAKAAGTLGGKKWPQFYSDCAAGMKDGGSTAAAETPTKSKTTKTASKSAPSDHQTTQQICSGQYQAAKSAGTLGGKKWSQFYSDCAADIRNDKSDASATPDEPKARKTATNYKASTVDKNGKPLTPGQIAFRQRIHECSVEYQSDKAADHLRGQKWPQYWSACNTRLKQEN
ncbi:MAG: hypothetical protein L0I29_12820 [Hyphomicrobiales bacterium]|nr:hypothetical protein [Hyphomicrobiales bacterium]